MFNLQKINIYQKTVIILFVIFVLFFIGQIIAGLIAAAYDPTVFTEISKLSIEDTARINFLKLLQFVSSMFTFIIPALIIAWLLGTNTWSFLKLNSSPQPLYYFLILVFLFSILPVMNIIIQWNESIVFPSALSQVEESMRSMEDSSKNMIELMLAGTGLSNILLSLFLVALLPALGEEFLFRGVLQKHFVDWFKNKHVAVFAAAFIFSAIHFQFYGFIPRLILGIIFGYLYIYSESLWTAIFAHFINNAMAVIAYSLSDKYEVAKNVETFGTNFVDIIYVVVGIAIAVYVGRSLFSKKDILLK